MKRAIAICVVVALSGIPYAEAGTWSTVDYPGATDTVINGISGSNLVGLYENSSGIHGFYNNGTSWTSLDAPGATYNTTINGISGNNLVGYYFNASGVNGCIYNLSSNSWATLDGPGAIGTNVSGIYGSEIFGSYQVNPSTTNGFIYNMADSSWINYDYPGATATWVTAIYGGNIFGYYEAGSSPAHSFLYDGTNWATLNVPGNVSGVSGSYIVGNSPTFIYDETTSTWTGLSVGSGTQINGIDGTTIVGAYESDGVNHGFVYEIPEPATLLLLGLGGLIMRKR